MKTFRRDFANSLQNIIYIATGDANKAVDIQDTHTPYLKLSHLEEGIL